MRLGLAVCVGVALTIATAAGVATLGDPSRRAGTWRPVGEICLLALTWLLANGPVEGRTLWVPVRGHGLTVADLAVAPALVVAAAVAAHRLAR